MSSNKHPKNKDERREGPAEDVPRPPSDLERNPGIKSSQGTFGRGTDPAVIEGENTFEGDVMNDPGIDNALPRDRKGRTNA